MKLWIASFVLLLIGLVCSVWLGLLLLAWTSLWLFPVWSGLGLALTSLWLFAVWFGICTGLTWVLAWVSKKTWPDIKPNQHH